jgi:hypothetical protein
MKTVSGLMQALDFLNGDPELQVNPRLIKPIFVPKQ